MRDYNHLFFDLDHTLWDFEANAKVALKDVFENYEIEKKIKDDFEIFFQKYSYHNKILWERYQNGFISAEELKWKRMWRTLLEFKVGDENLSKELGKSFLEILPLQKQMFPNAIETLEYLFNKKYTLHLITNGFEKTQWSKIKNSQIDHYFTHVITSEASNSMKPEKEIFEFAFHKANALPKESIMIGDNLDADILGATNAGIDSVFVNHINAPQTIPSTYSVTDLSQLQSIF